MIILSDYTRACHMRQPCYSSNFTTASCGKNSLRIIGWQICFKAQLSPLQRLSMVPWACSRAKYNDQSSNYRPYFYVQTVQCWGQQNHSARTRCLEYFWRVTVVVCFVALLCRGTQHRAFVPPSYITDNLSREPSQHVFCSRGSNNIDVPSLTWSIRSHKSNTELSS